MTSKLRIIVAGLIAQYPLGGLAWHYLQYVLGLARLGHDVYYLEDSGGWPYNPIEDGLGQDCSYNIQYLSKAMSRLGLDDKWIYCLQMPHKADWFGLPDAERTAVLQSADLLLDISGTLWCFDRYSSIGRIAYVDTDPVFTQLRLALDQADWWARVRAHHVHFTFGECLPRTELANGINWRATRQPIVLAEWDPSAPRRNVFTTIMNWTSYASVTYRGEAYGQKNLEFQRFVDLPGLVRPSVLQIAAATGTKEHTPRDLLADKGWQVVDPRAVCPDFDSYRSYIESSKAEWSVVKNAYVRGHSGWFSERSACYLAAGRPVVLQDTGFSELLPTGEGLLTFTNLEEAVEAIQAVEAHYDRHARMARAIAEEYFDSNKVLARMVDEAMS